MIYFERIIESWNNATYPFSSGSGIIGTGSYDDQPFFEDKILYPMVNWKDKITYDISNMKLTWDYETNVFRPWIKCKELFTRMFHA